MLAALMNVTPRLRVVILGLSITSSWGNGHATSYRSLVKGLARRGHDVLFLERNAAWYANRDLPTPPYGRAAIYSSPDELTRLFGDAVRGADLVIVGSNVPDGAGVAEWILHTARGMTAFYDTDTPVTLAMLDRGNETYVTRSQVPRFDLYLSSTGGPILEKLTQVYGAARARPFYCCIDAEFYRPKDVAIRWDLGYLGTHSEDRLRGLERLLLEPARRWPRGSFTVAGARYPASIDWPLNVHRREHVPPDEHPVWYAAQRFTLNLTRAHMAEAGWSPSIRLFEAAACGTPIVSDWWSGLDRFFVLGEEILLAGDSGGVLDILKKTAEAERRRVGAAARRRVLVDHTGDRRAEELERYVLEPSASPQ